LPRFCRFSAPVSNFVAGFDGVVVSRRTSLRAENAQKKAGAEVVSAPAMSSVLQPNGRLTYLNSFQIGFRPAAFMPS
jgi:hypothetical protein